MDYFKDDDGQPTPTTQLYDLRLDHCPLIKAK